MDHLIHLFTSHELPFLSGFSLLTCKPRRTEGFLKPLWTPHSYLLCYRSADHWTLCSRSAIDKESHVYRNRRPLSPSQTVKVYLSCRTVSPPCAVFYGPQSILDLSKPTSLCCSQHAHGLPTSFICLNSIPKPLVSDTKDIRS